MNESGRGSRSRFGFQPYRLRGIDDPLAAVVDRVGDAVDDSTALAAAPDCGFGTRAGLAMVDPEIALPKLDALGEGAAIASRRPS